MKYPAAKNKSLIIGCSILLILALVILFPAMFTKVSPYGVQTLKYWSDESDGGGFKFVTPAFIG